MIYYHFVIIGTKKIRRFITEDTYKGDIKDVLSLNYYAYCNGNPMTYVDPSGHDPSLGGSYSNEGLREITQEGYDQGNYSQGLSNDYAPQSTNQQGLSGPDPYLTGRSADIYVKPQDVVEGYAGDFFNVLGIPEMAWDLFGDPNKNIFRPKTSILVGSIVFGVLADGGADDMAKLAKKLENESRLADFLSGSVPMRRIALGEGIKDSARLLEDYGGNVDDWEKISGVSYEAFDRSKFEIHGYRNIETGIIYDPKTKIMR